MRRYLLIALLALFVASPALGQVAWTAAFEATPQVGDLLSQGDDNIREFKTTTRTNMTVEHDTSNIGGLTATSRHHAGAARGFLQAAEPANLVEDDTDPLGVSDDLDNGRIWVDHDDMQPWYREEDLVGGVWSDLNINHGANAADWTSLWPRSWSVSDIATDNNQQGAVIDTREVITGISIAVATPDDGRQYEIEVKGSCNYFIGNGEGIGCWLVQDVGPFDGDYKYAEITGATGAGSLDLVYILTGPLNGTTYTFTLEYACTIALDDDCVVNPEEGVGNVGAEGGDFNALPFFSRLHATVRPRYGVTDY